MSVKQAPPQYAKMLERFGKNPYGENVFRLVWGPCRTRIFGGYWEDVSKHEYRLVSKYGPTPQWVLEYWRPSIVYGSPAIWNMQTVSADGYWQCGPFPAHGAFEALAKFSPKNASEYGILPEPGLLLYSVMEHRLGVLVSEAQRKRIYEDDAVRKEREQDVAFDEMWQEAQLSRPGLSIGAAGAFNKQAEIDDYARKIERANAFLDNRKFRPGFKQQ
jgi:hypothetical protein